MKIHPKFRLNDQQFKSNEELILYAKSLYVEVGHFLSYWLDQSAYISVNTSGSTGVPTEIKLKKEQMINSAKATGTYFNLSENTSALLCMSSKYIAGKMMLVRAMVLGWHLTVVEPVSNPLKNLHKNFDFCAMVPLQVEASIDDLHHVKTLIIGGGKVLNALKSKLQNISTNVYATFGMTETITHIAIQKLNNFDSVIASKTKQSFFQSLPNIKVSIDNRNCLVIDAPLICDEKIITNDIIELVSENQFIWLGRYDNIINSGGVKLVPEQMEEKLLKTINKRFFITSEPDEFLGEKVILVIESKEFSAQEINQLKVNFKGVLTAYENPKSIYFIDKFVETETKKIQRSKTLDLIFKKPDN